MALLQGSGPRPRGLPCRCRRPSWAHDGRGVLQLNTVGWVSPPCSASPARVQPQPSSPLFLRRPRRRAPLAAALNRQLMALWGWITSGLFVLSMPLRLGDPVNAVKASASETRGPRAFASIVFPLGEASGSRRRVDWGRGSVLQLRS
jgi:hypothetical protein